MIFTGTPHDTALTRSATTAQPSNRPAALSASPSERPFQVLQPRRAPAQLSLFSPPVLPRRGKTG